MRVSVIQSNQKVLYAANNPGKFDFDTCQKLSKEVIDQTFELMEAAAKKGTDLIVTIEAINVSVFPDDLRYDFADSVEDIEGELFQRFCKFSKQYGVYVIGGLYNKRGENVYNSGILFGPSGKIEGIYDKVHLVGGEKVGLTPGNTYPVFETEFGKIGILVCWDMQFPEAARELVLGGADIIACPTWGWESIYGLARAYENDVVIATAMAIPPNGVIEGIRNPSCIVDGAGRIVAECSRKDAGFVTADIDLKNSATSSGIGCPREVRMGDRRPETYRLIR